MKEQGIKVTKLELNQDQFIKYILDNTTESSIFRIYKTINYIGVGVDIMPLQE